MFRPSEILSSLSTIFSEVPIIDNDKTSKLQQSRHYRDVILDFTGGVFIISKKEANYWERKSRN